MKTTLPQPYNNFPEYNYDVKLCKGLYYTLSPKYLKLNRKNYSIKPKDEVTLSTIGKFSIITIEAIGRTKVQYLVTIDFDKRDQDSLPKRNLPNDYIKYIELAKDNIILYNELIE